MATAAQGTTSSFGLAQPPVNPAQTFRGPLRIESLPSPSNRYSIIFALCILGCKFGLNVNELPFLCVYYIVTGDIVSSVLQPIHGAVSGTYNARFYLCFSEWL